MKTTMVINGLTTAFGAGCQTLGYTIPCVSPLTDQGLMDKKFEEFQQKHQKVYPNYAEYSLRRLIYASNMEYMKQENGRDNYSELGETFFSDMPNEEYRTTYGTPIEEHQGERLSDDAMLQSADTVGVDLRLPENIDWHQKRAVREPVAQGKCGASWASASLGAIEGQIQKATGKLMNLSLQHLLDCASGNSGCEGGTPQNAFDYITASGICLEKDIPYQCGETDMSLCRGRNRRCPDLDRMITGQTCDRVLEPNQVRGYSFVDRKTRSLMIALLIGPAVSAVDFGSPRVQHYKSGMIMPHHCGTESTSSSGVWYYAPDHSILVVGYGYDPHTNVHFWKVRNSHTSAWGYGGFGYLYREPEGQVNEANTCGILNNIHFPNVQQRPEILDSVEEAPNLGLAKKTPRRRHETDRYIYKLMLERESGAHPWTIHGLWPEWASNCPTTEQVDQACQNYLQGLDESARMWKFWPSKKWTRRNFWHHQWKKHGTCMHGSYSEPKKYFKTTVNFFLQHAHRCKKKVTDTKEVWCAICFDTDMKTIVDCDTMEEIGGGSNESVLTPLNQEDGPDLGLSLTGPEISAPPSPPPPPPPDRCTQKIRRLESSVLERFRFAGISGGVMVSMMTPGAAYDILAPPQAMEWATWWDNPPVIRTTSSISAIRVDIPAGLLPLPMGVLYHWGGTLWKYMIKGGFNEEGQRSFGALSRHDAPYGAIAFRDGVETAHRDMFDELNTMLLLHKRRKVSLTDFRQREAPLPWDEWTESTVVGTAGDSLAGIIVRLNTAQGSVETYRPDMFRAEDKKIMCCTLRARSTLPWLHTWPVFGYSWIPTRTMFRRMNYRNVQSLRVGNGAAGGQDAGVEEVGARLEVVDHWRCEVPECERLGIRILE